MLGAVEIKAGKLALWLSAVEKCDDVLFLLKRSTIPENVFHYEILSSGVARCV